MKLWEWNSAWMGLGLGLATTFFFTEGLKNLIGMPRPDLLARCNLDPAAVQGFALGGGEGGKLPLWNLLVSSEACRQADAAMLDDGFASFPSGHSSCEFVVLAGIFFFFSGLMLLSFLVSWAGMFYLALFLCSKFSVTIPYLLPYTYETSIREVRGYDGLPDDESDESKNATTVSSAKDTLVPLRKQAAAPPAYLFALPILCVSISTYVASTRFSDFRHHGFDILFGSLMGAVFSYISFRMYHLPVRRGAGWSWGPRSASRAWGIGVGTQGYANGTELLAKNRDVEAGNAPRNAGMASPNGA